MARFDVREATEFVTYAVENPQHWHFVALDLRLDFALTAVLACGVVAFFFWASNLLPGRK